MNPINCCSFSRGMPPTRFERSEISDIIRECRALGLVDELRDALQSETMGSHALVVRTVRDLVYELAGSSNRDLAVDALVHATGIAEFGCYSLRDYAGRHGITPEAFRQHVLGMQRRIGFPETLSTS